MFTLNMVWKPVVVVVVVEEEEEEMRIVTGWLVGLNFTDSAALVGLHFLNSHF